MFAPPDSWIDQFTTTVHATLRRCGCAINCCIEACLVGVGVAREFGYLAEPIPVRVIVKAGKQATVIPGTGSLGTCCCTSPPRKRWWT